MRTGPTRAGSPWADDFLFGSFLRTSGTASADSFSIAVTSVAVTDSFSCPTPLPLFFLPRFLPLLPRFDELEVLVEESPSTPPSRRRRVIFAKSTQYDTTVPNPTATVTTAAAPTGDPITRCNGVSARTPPSSGSPPCSARNESSPPGVNASSQSFSGIHAQSSSRPRDPLDTATGKSAPSP